MKHGKLFANIVYYLFTITVGVLLALFLPYVFMSDGEYLNMMESSLKKGEYSNAMLLVGGYFDSNEVFQEDFNDGGGIVIFCATTLVYSDSEEVKDETQIHKAYAGFVYNAKGYSVTAETDNQTKLLVKDGSGNVHTVKLLDGDSNGDGNIDTVTTYYTNGFFYFDLDEETYSSLRKLTFYNKEGQVYQEVSLELNYDQPFFSDVDEFVQEYNRDYKSEKLSQLNDAFLAKAENYKISTLGVAQSKADTKAAIIVVVYFVTIYVIGDLLLGQRYIIRFFKWFLFKVCKIKPKQKQSPQSKEVFGNDYFSQVTFELDISEAGDFSESVQIRYTNDKGEEISFLLLKQENYQTTQRIKAGTYVNMWIDLNKTEYATRDLPETLVVEGYRKTFQIKIVRREDKRDENFHS